MTLIEIQELIKDFNNEEKVDILNYFQKLTLNFLSYTGFEKKVYIFLDNNIIQDIKHIYNKTKVKDYQTRLVRFISEFLFFDFLKNHTDLEIEFAISPVVFYELSGRKLFKNETEYEQASVIVVEMINSISQLDVNFYGFNTYKELNEILNKVLNDEKKIIKIVKEIKSSDLKVDLKYGNLELLPLSTAFELLPDDSNLEYFHEYYVDFILASKIEQLIVNENSKEIRKKYLKGIDEFPLHGLVEIKKDKLKGLGDIELFQVCDFRYREKLNSDYIFSAITFDKKLSQVLSKRQVFLFSSKPINGKDNQESINVKITETLEEQKIMETLEHKERIFLLKVVDYIEGTLKNIIT